MGITKEYINLAGLRLDGRRPNEIRRIRCRMGLFSKVNGSSYFEQGNNKVIAVVYGPREVTNHATNNNQMKSNVACEFEISAFATSKHKKLCDKRKKSEYSLAIKQTFETAIMRDLYPRTTINIIVQVIQADGGLLTSSINAVTLALMDAGIAMVDFVVASSAACVDNTLLCDLNRMEENSQSPAIIVALHPKSMKLSLVSMVQKIPIHSFEQIMNTAIDGCKQTHEILQNEVRQNTWKLLNAKDKIEY